MAKKVFLDPTYTLNTVDLVDRVRSVSFVAPTVAVDSSDVSTADDAWLVGTRNFTMSVTFADDTAAANVEPTLWAIYQGRVAVPFTIRRSSDAISATNPEYQGNVLLTEIPFIDASRGDLMEMSVSFQGTGAITRDVTL